MRTVQDEMAEAILQTSTLVARWAAGFDDSNRVTQAPGLPNHAAWNLGHLALTMHRVAEKFDGVPPPGSDFTAGTRGDASRFGLESVSFGSAPSSDSAAYPSWHRCTEIFHGACERLAAAFRHADNTTLEKHVQWGQAQVSLGSLAARMVFHNGFHAGQIADLRRATGMKSIFG